ncbi:NAD(P)-dependent oxidoreductase [Microbacterium marinilacus]|uniref:Hydroxyacid dehydrogenase n=1 Tax=Microbacterium marinilacus TaxID=415209 RepID=A0ABP7BUL0_9MICO|nr:NAD(P)-dependent oxidoreductase [Microbacterium marinilacus]MBY0689140.1 hydroxyacid dehydrogenase [Microbacterium marinilacus]
MTAGTTGTTGSTETERPVVWVPRPVHDDALARLESWAEVARGWGDRPVGFDAICDTVSGILLRTERVDGDMMRRAPRLRIVARHGAGADTVDQQTAAQLGIRVTTTPGANSRAVAEHAVALLLAVRRGIGVAAREGAAADRALLTGRELGGATLGLLGFGRIAREVARIARDGFGMRVLAHDPFAPAEAFAAAGVESASLARISQESDAVSVHIPLTAETRGVVGAGFLGRLPPGAVVVNTSRGGVVDEDALLSAIASGHLAGAGLDVTTVEPLPGDHPLRRHPQVVVTPHVGGQTAEAMRRVALEAADALRDALSPAAAQTAGTI